MPKPPYPTYWVSRGSRKLDEPTSLAHLLPGGRNAPRGLGVRNQVSGTEFFHLVERLAAPTRTESLMALRALEQVPGWSRVPSPQRHLGSVCTVFRRDGTDGTPTILKREAASPENRLSSKDRRVSSKTFVTWLRTTYVRGNARGDLVLRLRKERGKPNALSILGRDEGGRVTIPETLDEALSNLGEGAYPEDVEGLRALWREYLRARETPLEREARREAALRRSLDALNERKGCIAARRRHDNEAKARAWALDGGPSLDRPALVDGARVVRNQVCGREFLHEVLGLADLNIHVERFVVAKALSMIPGWTRLPRPTLHRGQMQFVYRRDGTDGKPAPSRRRRIL